jgi:hypothetical protein
MSAQFLHGLNHPPFAIAIDDNARQRLSCCLSFWISKDEGVLQKEIKIVTRSDERFFNSLAIAATVSLPDKLAKFPSNAAEKWVMCTADFSGEKGVMDLTVALRNAGPPQRQSLIVPTPSQSNGAMPVEVIAPGALSK